MQVRAQTRVIAWQAGNSTRGTAVADIRLAFVGSQAPYSTTCVRVWLMMPEAPSI